MKSVWPWPFEKPPCPNLIVNSIPVLCFPVMAYSHWPQPRLGQGTENKWVVLYCMESFTLHINWYRAETYWPSLFWFRSLFLSGSRFRSVWIHHDGLECNKNLHQEQYSFPYLTWISLKERQRITHLFNDDQIPDLDVRAGDIHDTAWC